MSHQCSSDRIDWSSLDARMRALVAGRKSSGEIADALGVTRNAVIGRLRRLRLSLQSIHKIERDKCANRALPRHKVKRIVAVVKSGSGQRLAAKIRIERPDEAKADKFSPICEPIAFADLAFSSCRFPVSTDQPEQMYCGAARKLKSAFCEHHHRICYVPLPVKKGGRDAA